MTKKIKILIKNIISCITLCIILIIYFIILPFLRIKKIIRIKNNKKPRIFWGHTPIINIRYGSLAARLYGYKSDTYVYSVFHLNQFNDFNYVFSRYIKLNNIVTRGLLYIFSPYFFFLFAIIKYDIFHFYFDAGILLHSFGSNLELQLLRLAGKKTIVTAYGGDARLESKTRVHKYNFCIDCTPDTKTCNEKKINKKLDYFGKYADVILGCADLVDTLPRHEGMWFYPLNLSEWQPVELNNKNSSTVTVVHASNHRKYKGTRFLIAAIEELKRDGYPVELVLVERMLNDEAKEIYKKADIIADQFIGGAYALFAIEGMALGKPVLCYLRDDLYQFHPEWQDCPIVNTSPDNIREQLILLIENKHLREELGRKGIEYVKNYHSLESVGARLDTLYKKIWK